MQSIGVDIVELKRISAIKNKLAFSRKILSEKERKIYTTLKHENRQLEYLAGRWALKEAIYKAAPKLCKGRSFKDFSILTDQNGAPYLDEATVKTTGKMMLTLSHSKNYVVAFVVVLATNSN